MVEREQRKEDVPAPSFLSKRLFSLPSVIGKVDSFTARQADRKKNDVCRTSDCDDEGANPNRTLRFLLLLLLGLSRRAHPWLRWRFTSRRWWRDVQRITFRTTRRADL